MQDFAQHPPKRSWWSRNWRWVVPIGCLAPVVGILALVALILAGVQGLISSTEAFEVAVERAIFHPAVIERIGEPIETGWFVSGNVSTTGPTGEANLAIPLEGPNGKATLYLEAEKHAGEWTYTTLEVAFESGAERVDLIEENE